MSEVGNIFTMRDLYYSGVFTLIFKDQEMLEDFKEMVSLFNKTEQQILVEEVRKSAFEVRRLKDNEVCWELVMHKYISSSKDTRKNKAGEKYEPVIFTQLRLLPEETEKAV